MNSIDLEKVTWSLDDFDEMGWHDNKIYAVAFGIEEHELSFDIDYILQWVDPTENENHFKFLLVPCTLVFMNVYDLKIDISLLEVTIDEIYMENPSQPKNASFIKEQKEYDWIIETSNGLISFKSVGFKQYARMAPTLSDSQIIAFADRGGILFSKSTYL